MREGKVKPSWTFFKRMYEASRFQKSLAIALFELVCVLRRGYSASVLSGRQLPSTRYLGGLLPHLKAWVK